MKRSQVPQHNPEKDAAEAEITNPSDEAATKTALAVPLHRRALGTGSNLMAAGFVLFQSIIEAMERQLVLLTHPEVAAIELERNDVRTKIASLIGPVFQPIEKRLRAGRILEKIPGYGRPALDEFDSDNNRGLQAALLDFIDSLIGGTLPIRDEIGTMVKFAFQRDVPPDKFIAFFHDERVLGTIISELLMKDETRFRGNNLQALFASTFKVVIRRLKTFSERMRKSKVTAAVEKKLLANIQDFAAHYDPTDPEKTINDFIHRLQREYPEYDVLSWLKKNRQLITNVIKGESKDEYASPRDSKQVKRYQNIKNIIIAAYEQCGQETPEKFIKMQSRHFIYKEDCGVYARSITQAGINGDTIVVVNLDAITDFYNNVIPGIANGESSRDLAALRQTILTVCGNFLDEQVGQEYALMIRKNSEDGRSILAPMKYTNKTEMMDSLREMIYEACEILPSEIDVTNLLACPHELTADLARHHARWWPERKLDNDTYLEDLGRLFGRTITALPRAERPAAFKNRVRDMFRQVDAYLDSIANDLDIPTAVFDALRNINDYAELVRIANTTLDPQLLFAARRKLDLVSLLYTCQFTPQFVYQDHQAKAVRTALETAKDGIRIEYVTRGRHQSPAKRTMEFCETQNGEKRHSFSLILAKFGSVDCYLLPAREGGEVFIDKKRLPSMLTNLLSGQYNEKKRARDLTDLLRTTVIAENMDDLLAIQQGLQANFISFGRVVKVEDRYKKNREALNVGQNLSKADEYYTLRYVIEVPILDEAGKTVLATLEIRVMLLEDLCKEKSEKHPASHKQYERNRAAIVAEKVLPREINPERYGVIPPRPADLYKTKETKLKTAA